MASSLLDGTAASGVLNCLLELLAGLHLATLHLVTLVSTLSCPLTSAHFPVPSQASLDQLSVEQCSQSLPQAPPLGETKTRPTWLVLRSGKVPGRRWSELRLKASLVILVIKDEDRGCRQRCTVRGCPGQRGHSLYVGV